MKRERGVGEEAGEGWGEVLEEEGEGEEKSRARW